MKRRADHALYSHRWTMTHPSTCGREAYECERCGFVFEHLWGLPIHAGSLFLAYDGGPIDLPRCTK